MAVTSFSGGVRLGSVGDTYVDPGGRNIVVNKMMIDKSTAGTLTLKDADGTVIMTTASLGNGSVTQFDFSGGWEVNGFEYDATSAGSAFVTLFIGGTRHP